MAPRGIAENLGDSGTIVSTWKDPFQPFAALTAIFPGDMPDRRMRQAIDRQMTMLAWR